MNSNGSLHITKNRLRTLQGAIRKHNERLEAANQLITWFGRIAGLYASRFEDPAALPQIMLECRAVDEEICEALTAINKRINRRRRLRVGSGAPDPADATPLEPEKPSDTSDAND